MRASPDFRVRLDQLKRESTLQLLFKAARLVDELALARLARAPGRAPLRRSHTALLPHIDLGGTRLTELARRIGVSKQAVGQLVADLESWGVAERVPDETDGRARLVRFTARGRKGLLEGLARLRELEAELAAEIGDSKMAALRRGLVALLEEIESQHEGAPR